MIVIYKKVKKHNERKRAAQAQQSRSAVIDDTDGSVVARNKDSESIEKQKATPEQIAEKRQRTIYRWKIIIGLFSPFCLQALDTTIIASALPYIAEDFNQVSQLNWIISAFNLTSAAFLFFWAQLTDLFGRHNTLQAAVLLMVVGSAICTGSPTSYFSVLLLGRALQGIGAAGVNIAVRTILADNVSLADYALNWTIFALVSGVGFSIGPVIGGYLTQASWRWCFAINLPIGVGAMILIFFVLRNELQGPQQLPDLEGPDVSTPSARFIARLSTLDYGGQLLFLWGFGLLILALTWAGGTYSWNSAAVLVTIIIGGILSIGWIFYERCMVPGSIMARFFPRQKAMLQWELLTHRDIGLLFLINFSIGIGMFAVLYFMDLYFALVQKKSSSQAGTALLYYLPGLGAGVYMAMFSSNIWPRQTFPALFLGSITSAVGITVLAWAVHASKTGVIYGMMALVGHGVGIRLNPASLHGLAYFPSMTAPISCLVSFAIPFGGLVGLTTMSTVFTNKSGVEESNPKSGIMWAFIAMIPFMWLSVLLTTFLGNAWLLKGGGHEVVNRSFFWSLITRRSLVKERRDRVDLNIGQVSQSDRVPV